MQTQFDPDVLLPLARQAGKAANAEYVRRREELDEAYSKKPVRYGFLWLRRRPPTASEIQARVMRSSYFCSSDFDEAWFYIWRACDMKDMFKRIEKACISQAGLVELTENETLALIKYTTKG